jgi:hypothetical protein
MRLVFWVAFLIAVFLWLASNAARGAEEFPLEDSCTMHATDYYAGCQQGQLEIAVKEDNGTLVFQEAPISCTDMRMDYFFYCGPVGESYVVWQEVNGPRFSPQPKEPPLRVTTATPVPVPATLWLVLAGAVALIARRK